jgi:hypothetical protein
MQLFAAASGIVCSQPEGDIFMNIKQNSRFICLALPVVLSACGGSNDPLVVDDPKVLAATRTAQNNPACTALTSFYWEVGNVSGALASGQVGSSPPSATTEMEIASASKWLYGMYVVEKLAGAALSPTADVPYLNFTSGYSNFGLPTCPGLNGTIDNCLEGDRGTIDAAEAAAATFHYNSGHMQKHASNLGLGNLTAAGLTTEVVNVLRLTDPKLSLNYYDVQLAATVRTNATTYASLLRRMLIDSNQPLRIAGLLGRDDYATCTLTGRPCNAAYSPTSNDWRYSIGHWVEDDAAAVQAGDVAYSSAGAFGFYPWINQSRTIYGVLAREETGGKQEGFASAQCGKLIRRAYVTGTEQ